MELSYKILGSENLERVLMVKSQADYQRVANRQLTMMFNRAAKPPGTPKDTGELILSRRKEPVSKIGDSWKGAFYYTKYYGPFVEFGHRTRGGGYVDGQKYLYNNVEIQKKYYKKDILRELRRG